MLCSLCRVAHISAYLDGVSTALSFRCDPSVMKLSPSSAHKEQASCYNCMISTGVYGCVGMGMWQSGEGVVYFQRHRLIKCAIFFVRPLRCCPEGLVTIGRGVCVCVASWDDHLTDTRDFLLSKWVRFCCSTL